MSQRYFFEIAFDGSAYSGWQRQSNSMTVQETIENVLSKYYDQRLKIHGCGRTDAGVHASQYFFHIDLDCDPHEALQSLNLLLPADITILDSFRVGEKANAQKDALLRSYTYRFSNQKHPFHGNQIALLLHTVDIDLIKEALIALVGRHDFQNLSKRPELLSNTQCNISRAVLTQSQDERIYEIEITANRFLYHMMRLLVGNLFKVGSGRLTVYEFTNYLNLSKSPPFFELAPAKGLTLSSVQYSKNIWLDTR